MDKISPRVIKKIKDLCDKGLPSKKILKIISKNGISLSLYQINYYAKYFKKGFGSREKYNEWMRDRKHYLDALVEGDDLREIGYDFESLRYVNGNLIIDIKKELAGEKGGNIEKKAVESDFKQSVEEYLAHIKEEGVLEETLLQKDDFILGYRKNSLIIKPKNKKSIEAAAFLSSCKKIWGKKN